MNYEIINNGVWLSYDELANYRKELIAELCSIPNRPFRRSEIMGQVYLIETLMWKIEKISSGA